MFFMLFCILSGCFDSPGFLTAAWSVEEKAAVRRREDRLAGVMGNSGLNPWTEVAVTAAMITKVK